MKKFLALWISQVLSGTGSLLTSFSIGVWVFQSTHSVLNYALVLFFATLPSLLLSPVTGAIVDRSDRKRIMILSDAGAMLINLALILFLVRYELSLPLVFLFLTASSACNNFQWPAYASWVSQLVPKKDYGRAGGLLKLGEGIPYLIAPLAGGYVTGRWGLHAVLAIDLCTFLLSLGILLCIPGTARPHAAKVGLRIRELATEARQGFSCVARHRGLLWLLGLSPLVIFSESWVIALFQPYVLLFLPPASLGVVLAVGGIGMAIGGVAMGMWGGPRRRIWGVLGFIFLQGLIVIMLGAYPFGMAGIAAMAFLYFLCIPFLSGSNQAIWQAKIPLELQGRVFSLTKAVESLAAPAAFLSAGILSQPLAGAFAGTLLPRLPAFLEPELWAGRELGLAFLAPAAIALLAIAAALLIPSLRRIDDLQITDLPRTGKETEKESRHGNRNRDDHLAVHR